jgi:hypothetical protein
MNLKNDEIEVSGVPHRSRERLEKVATPAQF